jgi:hypothetical protein
MLHRIHVEFDIDVQLWSKYEERWKGREDELARIKEMFSESIIVPIHHALYGYKIDNFMVDVKW